MRFPRFQLPGEPPPVARWEWVALVLATIAGAVLRFAKLQTLPPGLWYDEAINGIDALTIIREPGWPLFFTTANHFREPIWMYLEALGVLVGGTTAPALRGVGAVAGTLAIPAVWWMARELGGRRMALLTLLCFVPMRWHVHFSHLAFRTMLTTLFCPLIIACAVRALRRENLNEAVDAGAFDASVLREDPARGLLNGVTAVRALHRRRLRYAAAAGVLAGLSLATYLSMRLFAIALAGAVLMHVLPRWREGINRRVLIVGFVAFLAGFAPLGFDYLRHPDHISGRQSEISLFDQGAKGWLLMAKQARDVALMTTLRGDHEAKHSIPGPPRFIQAYLWTTDPIDSAAQWQDIHATLGDAAPDVHGTGMPVFDILTGLVSVVGFGLLLIELRRGQWRALLVLAWIGLGSLASIVSFGAPNMLRLLFLAPALAFVVALALDRMMETAVTRGHARAGAAALVCFGLWFAAGETWRFFAVWPRDPSVWWKFNGGFREAADWLRDSTDRPATIIAPGYFLRDTPTFSFLADGVTGLVADDAQKDFSSGAAWVLAPHPPYPPLTLPRTISFDGQRAVRTFAQPDGTVWLTVYALEIKTPGGS